MWCFFFSSVRRHTSCALVTGVQTCALPICHALLADRLGQIDAPRMTATEVLERSAEMARLLGATFGRLQSELLFPLIHRAVAILQRRGELPPFALDGREVALVCQSPLARAQEIGRASCRERVCQYV